MVDVEFSPVTQVLHCKMEGKLLTVMVTGVNIVSRKFMELAATRGLKAIPLLAIRLSGYMNSSCMKEVITRSGNYSLLGAFC